MSAFCFPEPRIRLYHHVSSQIVVRGLDVGSAREAAVLVSQTRRVSPPSGAGSAARPEHKLETQLHVPAMHTHSCLRWYSFRICHKAVYNIALPKYTLDVILYNERRTRLDAELMSFTFVFFY